MKALKVAVATLAVIIGGLSFTIYRLQHRALQEQPVPAPVSEVAATPAAPAAPQIPPAPTVMPEPDKPSPVRAPARVRDSTGREKAAVVASNQTPAAVAPAAPAEKSLEPSAPTGTRAPAVAAEPPAPAKPRSVTIPAGTTLVVRTQNKLSTERNFTGDTFTAALAQPLEVDGVVIAEKGAEVEGRVVRSEKAGRVEGVSSLEVELVRLQSSDGQKLSIATAMHQVRGERSRGSDAKKVGVATGLGAIIGAIAGGGKGAAIGAGVGAGAGAGTVLVTRGEHAEIPSESVLRFELGAPVTVTENR